MFKRFLGLLKKKDNKLEKIHPQMIAKKCKTKIPDDFIWLAENKVNLLKYYFQSSNNIILSKAVIDFKEDKITGMNTVKDSNIINLIMLFFSNPIILKTKF